jgi:hypothetical protein
LLPKISAVHLLQIKVFATGEAGWVIVAPEDAPSSTSIDATDSWSDSSIDAAKAPSSPTSMGSLADITD